MDDAILIEIHRKEREDKLADIDRNNEYIEQTFGISKSRAEVIRNSDMNTDYQEKYIYYRLSFLDPEKDCELYHTLYVLMNDFDWVPTDHQIDIEHNMFEDIWRELELFSGGDSSILRELRVASGEVLLYYANLLAYEMCMTKAKACELLLENLYIPVGQPDDNFICEYREFLDSDYNPEATRFMFGVVDHYYDWICFNGSFSYEAKDGVHYSMVPTWGEQFQYYLETLTGGMDYFD